MKVQSKDFLWITALAAAILLLLNILIQSSFHKQRIADKRLLNLELIENNKPSVPPDSQKTITLTAEEEKGELHLPYELRGTIVGFLSLAFIYNLDTQRPGLYRLNEFIDGYKIAGITPGKVILKKNDTTRELLLAAGGRKNVEDKEPVISTDASGKMFISRSGIISQIPRANELLRKVKILLVSDTASNKVKGFRIDNVPSESIIEDAGIKNGDVICSVEGRNLASVKDAMQTLNFIRKQSGFEVVLLRQDKPVTLRYEFRN